MNKEVYNFLLNSLIDKSILENGTLNIGFGDKYNQWTSKRDDLNLPTYGTEREKLPEFKEALKDYKLIKESPLYKLLEEKDDN